MRILSINKYHYIKGGSETYCFGLNGLLQQKGHEIIPLSMKDAKNTPSPYEGFFINNIDFNTRNLFKKFRYSINAIYSFEAAGKVSSVISDQHPDIAHLHVFQHHLSPSVVKSIKRHGIPCVNTVHDLKPLCPNYTMYSGGRICESCFPHRYYHCLAGKCIKGSLAASATAMIEMYLHLLIGSYRDIDLFITPSEFYRQKFLRYGFPPDKLMYLPNFIDCREYPNTADTVNTSGYILYFGRLSAEKGVSTLLKAMAKPGMRSLRLVIAGDGPEKAKLLNEAENCRLSNVEFHGHIDRNSVRELIECCLFTVVPSEWYENCPYSVLEAMACGKAVIGSDIGGIPELVKDGTNGLLFEPGCADSLAERIAYLASHPAKAAAMGKEGRVKAEAEHDPQKHADAVIASYESLLTAFGGKPPASAGSSLLLRR